MLNKTKISFDENDEIYNYMSRNIVSYNFLKKKSLI